jgi:glycogen(starch) synthase
MSLSQAQRPSLRLPSGARIVLCGGDLTRAAGIKDAIWAADILKYLYDDLYLLILGDGPERFPLEQFARDIRIIDHVRFVGPMSDLAALVELADVVWIPCLSGEAPALLQEALSSGRPVVASNLPAVRAVVSHGENGFLVPPGDKAALARFSRVILDGRPVRQASAEVPDVAV